MREALPELHACPSHAADSSLPAARTAAQQYTETTALIVLFFKRRVSRAACDQDYSTACQTRSLCYADYSYSSSSSHWSTPVPSLFCALLLLQAIKFFIYFGLYYTLRHDRINEEADEVVAPKEVPSHPVDGAKIGTANGGGGGSLCLRAASLGRSRPGSLNGPPSRAELRTSLAAEVLATAEGRGSALKLDDPESGGGRDARAGQTLQRSGGSGGSREGAASLYLQLEMTPVAASPGACAALPGRPRSAGV